jgi:hypothetical protein
LLRHHHPCRLGEIGPRDLPLIGPQPAHAGCTSTHMRKHTISHFDVDFVNTGCGVFRGQALEAAESSSLYMGRRAFLLPLRCLATKYNSKGS